MAQREREPAMTRTTLKNISDILAGMVLGASIGFLIIAIVTSVNQTRALTPEEIEAVEREAMATVLDATRWIPGR